VAIGRPLCVLLAVCSLAVSGTRRRAEGGRGLEVGKGRASQILSRPAMPAGPGLVGSRQHSQRIATFSHDVNRFSSLEAASWFKGRRFNGRCELSPRNPQQGVARACKTYFFQLHPSEPKSGRACNRDIATPLREITMSRLRSREPCDGL